MEQTLEESYRARALELGKGGCTREELVKGLADYALDNNHGAPGVAIAITLADRMIASEKIPAGSAEIQKAKESLNPWLYRVKPKGR